MAICKRETIWSGNTYPARDEIKALGGQWDASTKTWTVPALSMRERATAGQLAHQYRIRVSAA